MSKKSRALGRYGSFKPRSNFKTGLVRIVKFILLFFLIYQLFSVMIVSSYQIDSDSMNPLLKKGQRILSSPFITGINISLFHISIPGLKTPERGDIVVTRPGNAPEIPWYLILTDPLIRFFTFQEKSLVASRYNKGWNNFASVKRIIGIPGDTVKYENGIFFVKPEGTSVFVRESDISIKEYDVVYSLSENSDLHFADSSKQINLGENEYFVASDNRNVLNDSRMYGPVSSSDIKGLVFMIFWPGISFP